MLPYRADYIITLIYLPVLVRYCPTSEYLFRGSPLRTTWPYEISLVVTGSYCPRYKANAASIGFPRDCPIPRRSPDFNEFYMRRRINAYRIVLAVFLLIPIATAVLVCISPASNSCHLTTIKTIGEMTKQPSLNTTKVRTPHLIGVFTNKYRS